MQDFIFTAITSTEKCNLFLDDLKLLENQRSVKYRLRVLYHGACLTSV